MFLENDKLVWRDKTVPLVHVMHVHFMFLAVLKNVKSLFSEDNMPKHALDIFIENAKKWFNSHQFFFATPEFGKITSSF